MLISLSSTAIVLKILSEKNQVDSPHGKLTLGILIFQDLAVVPMFIILPLFVAEQTSSTAAFLLQLFLAFGSLAVIIILSRFIMPRVLYHLAHLRIREAFTIGTILLLLGTAYITHSLALSFAIGAFIAGVIMIAPMSVDIKKAKFNDHVIIDGFGLNGRNLARVLKEAGIPYVVIELNPKTIKEGKSVGENMIYGVITKEEILIHAGIKTARVIVFAISDPPSTKTALKIAKTNNKAIKAIVRTRYINEIDELLLLGADEIIPEEFETSLQIFSKVLEKYHLPLNIIMKQVSILRGESYSLLRKEKADVNSFIHLDEILAAGLTSIYFINEDNYHTGQTLEQLNLRAKTDATIIAIVRENRTISNPSGKDKIESNDTLVITGTHKSVDLAFSLLDGKD
jgi:voltage-gated potassium channel Kch